MTNPSTGTVPPDRAGGDPLARLHKMSTTAGITSQEYVAINIPSIVATLLGLASVLALIERVLLVLPLAAIVVGVVALVQIRDSNGTQTGRWFAWTGIVLALAFGGTQLAKRAIQASAVQNDQREVAAVLETLGGHIARRDYPTAYAMFGDRFRQRVPLEAFVGQWNTVAKDVAPLKGVSWNNVPMEFSKDGTGATMAAAMAVFAFEGVETVGRQSFFFRKMPSGWVIEDIPAMFPTEKRGAPPQ